MSFEAAIAFFIAIFIFGITPGPGIFALLARSLNRGVHSCWGLSLGMTISDIIYLVLACFGLAAIASQWSDLFMIIRIVGGLYLIYLGYKMWTSKPTLDIDTAPIGKKDFWHGVFQGFLISASNPKVILFYLAFLPSFMDLTTLSLQDIGLAAVLTFFGLMLGLMLVSLLADQLRQSLKSNNAMLWINRVAGSIMMLAGGYLLKR